MHVLHPNAVIDILLANLAFSSIIYRCGFLHLRSLSLFRIQSFQSGTGSNIMMSILFTEASWFHCHISFAQYDSFLCFVQMDSFRKYPCPTTDTFHILTSLALTNSKMHYTQYPRNFIIIPSPLLFKFSVLFLLMIFVQKINVLPFNRNFINAISK